MTLPLGIQFTQVGALIVAAIATVTDLKSRKIYNVLTFPSMLIGMIARGILFALAAPNPLWGFALGFGDGFLGCLAGIFSQIIFRSFQGQWVAAGDAKLVGALGAFLGPAGVFIVVFFHAIVFGLYSIVRLAIALPWSQLPMAVSAKSLKVANWEHFNEVRKRPLALAPLIAAGLVLAIIFNQQARAFFGIK